MGNIRPGQATRRRFRSLNVALREAGDCHCRSLCRPSQRLGFDSAPRRFLHETAEMRPSREALAPLNSLAAQIIKLMLRVVDGHDRAD